MHYKPIESMEDITFDDRAVGVLALVTMYQVVTFLILQLILFLPALIIQLLAEKGILEKEMADTISISVHIFIELSLIVWLVRRGKKAFLTELSRVWADEAGEASAADEPVSFAFTEGQLETAVGLVAGISIAWCMVFDVDGYALKILLTIVETFAFIFLITFITVRFLATREVRRTAIYCLILTALSLWLLTTGF